VDDAMGAYSAAGVDAWMAVSAHATPCSAAKNRRECLGLKPPTSDRQRCSWCTHSGVGVCVACDGERVSQLARDGYTCARDAARCAEIAAEGAPPSPGPGARDPNVGKPAPPSTPASKPAAASPSPSSAPTDATDGVRRKKRTPPPDSEYPTPAPAPSGAPPPNEGAAALAKLITSDSLTKVAPTVLNEIIPVMRKRATDKLVRGTVREAVGNITLDVAGELLAVLPHKLIPALSAAVSRKLAMALAATLPQALVPSITESLTHDPVADYVCAYCASSGLHCTVCTDHRMLAAGRSHVAWQQGAAAATAASAGMTTVEAQVVIARALADASDALASGGSGKAAGG